MLKLALLMEKQPTTVDIAIAGRGVYGSIAPNSNPIENAAEIEAFGRTLGDLSELEVKKAMINVNPILRARTI